MTTQRRRNNTYAYALEVDMPNGDFIRLDQIDNLDKIAHTINVKFFNGFAVVSRAMVNNWLYQPNTPRKSYAEAFNITKYEVC